MTVLIDMIYKMKKLKSFLSTEILVYIKSEFILVWEQEVGTRQGAQPALAPIPFFCLSKFFFWTINIICYYFYYNYYD